MLGQRGDCHGLVEPDTAQGAVTTGPLPGPSAAAPYGELVELYGQSPLQHFGVREPRVGHVGLDDGRPWEPVAGAGSGGDGLVVLVVFVAEGDVVHGAGALGLDTQRGVEGAGDGLGGLHVARDDRCRGFGSEHGTGRHDDVEGAQAAVVERDVVVDKGPEDIQDRRVDDREGGVEVRGELRGRAGEVDGGGAVLAVHAHAYPDDRARVGLVGVLPVVQSVDDPAYRFLRVVLDVLHVCLDDGEAKVVDHPGDFVDALLVGRDLGAQICEVGLRVAGGVGRLGEQPEGLLLPEAAFLGQQPVVEEDSLLLDGAAVRGHGAGGDAADLRVVTA